MSVSVVVPTIGRASLARLLESLNTAAGTADPALRLDAVVLVDDRSQPAPLDLPLHLPALMELAGPLVVRRSGGRGPAAARNVGWRATASEWVAFLDDDVLVDPSWFGDLAADLAPEVCGPDVAGSQGRISVPLPAQRRPTDWERGTAGLADAAWITADMAYRRGVLDEVGGFDERFPRAFREDADLALRVLDAGHRLTRGRRRTVHPVRPAPWNASARQQRGNADDALMRRLHGPDWYDRAAAGRGRLRRHVAITAALATAVSVAPVRRRWARGLAALAGLGWLAGTAEFARARIAPGPRTPAELAAMTATSIAIPPLAVRHRLAGELRWRRARAWRPMEAVLVDRDGTIVVDVPYNGDPERVEPMPAALAALDRVRAAGLPIGVVTNQSAIGRGLASADDVAAVNERVDKLLGPIDTWQICPHAPADGCECRKPAPALVLRAAAALGVRPERCVVIGDIGTDMAAARAAGARAILVPTEKTRAEEVAAAPVVCSDLGSAVDLVLSGRLA